MVTGCGIPKGKPTFTDDKEMFIGSFHRVVSKTDIDSRIPTSSSPCIVYVEEEKKLYEKNTYGMVTEYLSDN